MSEKSDDLAQKLRLASDFGVIAVVGLINWLIDQNLASRHGYWLFDLEGRSGDGEGGSEGNGTIAGCRPWGACETKKLCLVHRQFDEDV